MSIEILDEHYDETYLSVLSGLERMIHDNPQEAEAKIRGILKHLYIRQGNDWTGRGALGDAELNASIAAYEAVLAELRK